MSSTCSPLLRRRGLDGLSTRTFARDDGRIKLEELPRRVESITPHSYVDHFAALDKQVLFIYATCDTTFLPEYSRR